jgi:MFS transporter, ACS family, hexuronate transporter
MGTSARKIANLRWWICGLLFFGTTINYVDRVALGALNPMLKKEIGWDDAQFGWIMFAFQLSYAITFAFSGRLLDKWGVRKGMIWAVIIWSIACMGHALAASVLAFAVARFLLGIGEAANFPGSIKAVAEWFPKRQRALATGIFNSGTNLGAMSSALIVAAAAAYGWQQAFVVMGALGFVWLIAWYKLFHTPAEHPNLSAEERALIESDRDTPAPAMKVHWTALLRYRQAWAFFIAKMMSDPVWWFYLYWLPYYLTKERGVSATMASKMLILPYVAASVGSVFGGWISGHLVKKGWHPGKARLYAMGGFALGLPAAIGALYTGNVWVAVGLLSIATGCHQAWSANVFTLSSDFFPKEVVGSVVGFGSMCGGIGGMFMTLIAGGMLQWFGSFKPLLMIAGVMHLTAWTIARTLVKDFKPADLNDGRGSRFSPGLLWGGIGVAVVGGGLATLVGSNFDYIAKSAKSLSTAAGGLSAAIGVCLIGGALMYASRSRPNVTVQS